MNGSREELENRIHAAQKVLSDMERSLESAKKLIEETQELLEDIGHQNEDEKDLGAA